jgi:magnesium transporter
LHLHPLTLEDILHREPREKLELFPKLGYSFIVFRAIESSTQNERLDVVSQRTSSSQLPFQSVTSEICIYLVVFRDGICTVGYDRPSTHAYYY